MDTLNIDITKPKFSFHDKCGFRKNGMEFAGKIIYAKAIITLLYNQPSLTEYIYNVSNQYGVVMEVPESDIWLNR